MHYYYVCRAEEIVGVNPIRRDVKLRVVGIKQATALYEAVIEELNICAVRYPKASRWLLLKISD